MLALKALNSIVVAFDESQWRLSLSSLFLFHCFLIDLYCCIVFVCTSSSLEKVFFSQENYKKFSCLPSLVEFLGKHLNSSAVEEGGSSRSAPPKVTDSSGNGTDGGSNRKNESKRSNSPSTSLSPEMEFPFVSKISRENQKLLLDTFEMIKAGNLANADFQKLKSIQVSSIHQYIVALCILRKRPFVCCLLAECLP